MHRGYRLSKTTPRRLISGPSDEPGSKRPGKTAAVPRGTEGGRSVAQTKMIATIVDGVVQASSIRRHLHVVSRRCGAGTHKPLGKHVEIRPSRRQTALAPRARSRVNLFQLLMPACNSKRPLAAVRRTLASTIRNILGYINSFLGVSIAFHSFVTTSIMANGQINLALKESL